MPFVRSAVFIFISCRILVPTPARAAPAARAPAASGSPARLPRLYVVPVQPGAAGVSALVARRVNARLRMDLAAESSLELLPPLGKAARVKPRAIYQPSAPPAPDERADGARLLAAGRRALDAKRYLKAQRLLLRAIGHFERSVAHLRDGDRLARAFGFLGLALLRQRKWALGAEAIETAYALDPTLKLEQRPMPRSLRRRVVRAGRRALRRRKGLIRVTTKPPGARVFVDGDDKGRAPLTWPEVVPGRHYVAAQAAGRLARGEVVTVKPAETVTVELTLPAARPRLSTARGLAPAFQAELERRLRAALVDRRVKPLAHQLAVRLGADFVLLGAVERDPGGGYRLGAFLYRDMDQRLVALDAQPLDAELLGLAAATGKLSDAAAGAVARFPVARDITFVRRAQAVARAAGSGPGGLVGLRPGGDKGRVHSTGRPWYLRWSFWGAVIGVAVAGGLVGLGVGVYQATHQPVQGYTVGVVVR